MTLREIEERLREIARMEREDMREAVDDLRRDIERARLLGIDRSIAGVALKTGDAS